MPDFRFEKLFLKLSPLNIFFDLASTIIYLLHNATRVGRNPMLRADSLHAYMLTCLHAYMLTCLHAYTLTCLLACKLTCLHAYTLTCVHAYMHVRSCLHA